MSHVKSSIRERLLNRIAWSRLGASIVRRRTAVTPESDGRPEAVSLKEDATAAWQEGRKVEAIDLLRRSLLVDPSSSGRWLLSSQWLLETKQPAVAFASILNALDSNPANLMALELFYDMTRQRPRGRAMFARALDRLALAVPERPEAQRGALDFAVAHRHLQLLSALSASADPFVGLVLALEAGERGQGYTARSIDEVEALLSTRERAVARGVHALARGRMAAARASLISVEPSVYPLDSLRRAVRRAAAQEKHGQTAAALRLFLAAKPDDAWAIRKLATSEQLHATESAHASIVRRGYSFGTRTQTPAYDADRRTAFYLLHNSLPETSNGYATRSHGLLSGMVRAGWGMDAMTRPGFPFDLPSFNDVEVSESVIVDDVRYRRFTDGNVPKDPVTDFVQLYTNGVVARARESHPFVIHAASNHLNGLAAVEAGRAVGVPSIYEVRGLWEVTRASRNPGWEGSERYQLMKQLETDAARSADVVLAITGALRTELIDRGVDEGKIVVVPNGVDSSRFVPVARDLELAGELGVQGKSIIGYVGSVLDYEGIGLLIEAAAGLASTRTDFRVLVVGDGAERAEFERLAIEHGVRDLVIFTGRVPHHEVERYYSLVDIAPFPRLPLPVTEMVSPLKPFEAMAMGKAVVASDVQALAEIVDDGVTGLLHRKGDARDLQAKLEILLDRPELVRSLGEAALRWVRTERDWSVIASKVSEVYEQLGGKRETTSGEAR
ncbi:glycosyltransferase [Isoptericola sp. NPDC056134]|uniref:glycosyltransferase n=1 Tax=Isoptericola sp. NPDC056134 TaxID=3345723 RepID=UPI0035EB5176